LEVDVREVILILFGLVAILAMIWFMEAPENRYGYKPVAKTSTS
jgi:hypothetical protein